MIRLDTYLRPVRPGFALPMVILVTGIMTAGLMAAFARSSAEVGVVDNQRAQTDAFAMAQSGLERYLLRGQPTPWDTTVAGGGVSVRAYLVRSGTAALDTAIYVVRATGWVSGGGSLKPRGRRTVAQYAYHVPGKMNVHSSWTSLSGILKNGAAGDISGYDPLVNSDTCGGGVPKAGVAVPTDGYTQVGGTAPVYGVPPILEMGTQAAMASQIRIDWTNISNPSAPAIPPYSIRCMPGTYGYNAAWSPCGGWPTSAQFADPGFWPVLVINGTSSLPVNGKGTIIVTGDLILGGSDVWDGIVLVGGRIIDNGTGDISGAVVTGLNVLKGETIAESSRANGTKDYVYDSCKIRNAARGMATLSPIRNAWVDNWRTW